MRYTVNAYLCANFAGLMDNLETDSFDEAQDFVWENVQKGYNCELTDNEVNGRCQFYADNFTEATVEPNDLLDDLLMEQREQM